ncbi:hypothetical protein B0H10DRAFT_291673 [Mycena sp. CBHHK59/15]|nr:hypothetical protein B0H10DRAFT_291673 [Mycena sp. CBHHK59/15]
MSSHAQSLPKGQACLDCRRRKIKCDSIRPICGPCSRACRSEDCEYMDGGGTSNMQRLEENISRIQTRIMDLEHPGHAPPTVMLRNPYNDCHYQQSFSCGDSSQSRTTEGITVHILRLALDTFSPYALEFGFFLHQARFRNACLRSASMGSGHEQPPGALLSSICLWGACLSSSEPLASQESSFLSRALRTATTALSSNHPLKVIYAVQTEVLLCQYFLHKGRLLEAQYHLSLAVSYVVLGDLAKLRSSRASQSHGSSIPVPRDSIEEGELIRGFWTVVSLDKSWSAILNFPSNFIRGEDTPCNVDTPWPLEMEEYERNQLQQLRSAYTVESFVDDVPGSESDGVSFLAILAKSAILLDRATLTAQKWSAHMTSTDSAVFFDTFTKLNARIKKFRDSLPSPQALAGSNVATRQSLILGHTLAHAATIQLNRTFIAFNPRAKDLCLGACRSIVHTLQAVNPRHLVHVNPIIGAVWAATGRILVEEVLRLRAFPSSAPAVADMTNAYNELVASVTLFSKNCPFMQFQLGQLRASGGF